MASRERVLTIKEKLLSYYAVGKFMGTNNLNNLFCQVIPCVNYTVKSTRVASADVVVPSISLAGNSGLV